MEDIGVLVGVIGMFLLFGLLGWGAGHRVGLGRQGFFLGLFLGIVGIGIMNIKARKIEEKEN